jgi:hypothetical protein
MLPASKAMGCMALSSHNTNMNITPEWVRTAQLTAATAPQYRTASHGIAQRCGTRRKFNAFILFRLDPPNMEYPSMRSSPWRRPCS